MEQTRRHKWLEEQDSAELSRGRPGPLGPTRPHDAHARYPAGPRGPGAPGSSAAALSGEIKDETVTDEPNNLDEALTLSISD